MAIGAVFASSATVIAPQLVAILAVYVLFGSIVMAGAFWAVFFVGSFDEVTFVHPFFFEVLDELSPFTSE